MITFKSSFINNVNIPIIKPEEKKTDQGCSLVEFNTNSESDYKLLKDLSKNWNNGRSYAADVFDYFSVQRVCQGKTYFPNHRYFGLIENTNDKVNSDSVLGVINILEQTEDNSCILAYLQVNPENVYGAENRKLKHIGELLVKNILDIISAKTYKAIAVNKNSKLFFEKLNFIKSVESAYMVLKR